MFVHRKKSNSTAQLQDAIDKNFNDRIPIEDIMMAMNTGGFGLVLMFFSLPILIPLPPPLPSLISMPLVIFAIQMMAGIKAPKLPKMISKKTIQRTILAHIIEKSAVYFSKAEAISKPRLIFLSSGIFEKIIGFFFLIFSISILIPLPLTNFLPGMGILIASFGLIGKDGVIIIIGLLVGIIGIAVACTAFFLGVEILGIAKNLIFDIFAN